MIALWSANTVENQQIGIFIMTSSAPRDASYFDCDFDFDEWRVQCAERPLPLIKPLDNCDEEQYSRWNNFYQSHITGNFFKPRKYLSVEFEKWSEECRGWRVENRGWRIENRE